MSIEVSCTCGKRIAVQDKLAGKRVRCGACGAIVEVPREDIPEVDVQVLLEDEQEDSSVVYHDGSMTEASSGRALAGELGTIKLRDPAGCVAYAPNNAWGAAGIQQDIQVLDMKNHKRAFKFRKHHDPVTSLCFAPDAPQILSGDKTGGLLLWDMERRKAICWLEGHEREVTALAFGPNGRYAVSGSADGSTRLWDLKSRRELELFEAEWDDQVTCVGFSPDGSHVAAGGMGSNVGLWSVETGEPIRRLKGASATIASLSFSKEGDFLTACGVGGALTGKCKVWQWQIPSGKPLACWENPSKNDCSILLSEVVPGGNYLVSVGLVSKEKHPPGLMARLMTGPDASGAAELVHAGALIFGMAKDMAPPEDYRLQVWSVQSGLRIQNFLFTAGKPLSLSIAPSSSRALLATAKGRVHVWGLGQL